jgi:hypothetical protein
VAVVFVTTHVSCVLQHDVTADRKLKSAEVRCGFWQRDVRTKFLEHLLSSQVNKGFIEAIKLSFVAEI